MVASLLLIGCAATDYDRLIGFAPTTAAAPTDFDAIAAYAAYAQAAYPRDDEIMQAFPNTVRISTPGGNGARYFFEVSEETQTQTISVRGTHTFNAILHDIEFEIVPNALAAAPLHRGFEAEARLIYADIQPHLNPAYRTRLTGHSLGATVSAIMMIYLQRDGFEVERSINFGQPKFTNTAGAELYSDLDLLRVVDANDVVPMLPPRFSLHPSHGPYAHVGEEVILLDGPYFVLLEAHDAERISVDKFWRDRNFASGEDHHMARYLERIGAKRDVPQQVDYATWRSLTAH